MMESALAWCSVESTLAWCSVESTLAWCSVESTLACPNGLYLDRFFASAFDCAISA